MPIRIICEACSTPLKVPEHLAGRSVKCPTCGESLCVTDDSIATAPLAPPGDRPRQRRREEETPDSPEPDDQPPRRRRDERITSEPDSVEERSEDLAPRKRKRNKRRKQSAEPRVPAWVWWLGSTAFVFLTLVGLVVGAAFAGAKAEAIFIGVYLLISIPVSAVILVVSMIFSSAIVGGMDFGEVHVAIPKALGLLFVVNLVSLIPFAGWFVALVVWVGGRPDEPLQARHAGDTHPGGRQLGPELPGPPGSLADVPRRRATRSGRVILARSPLYTVRACGEPGDHLHPNNIEGKRRTGSKVKHRERFLTTVCEYGLVVCLVKGVRVVVGWSPVNGRTWLLARKDSRKRRSAPKEEIDVNAIACGFAPGAGGGAGARGRGVRAEGGREGRDLEGLDLTSVLRSTLGTL
jgi:hypothetical protein